MAVQYNSEKGKIYYPWKQAIKSLGAKPRTEITQEEIDWWDDKDHRPNIVQKSLEGQTKEKQAEILDSYKIPTKELEKFVTAQKHVNDGISRMMSTLNIEGYNTSFL